MVSLRLYARDRLVAAELLRHLRQRLKSSRHHVSSMLPILYAEALVLVLSLYAPVLAPPCVCLCGRACMHGCEDVAVVEGTLI